MKLLTNELTTRFAKLGDQDVEDPIVVAKFFNPCGRSTWYATAYHPQDRVFFGYCQGEFGPDCDEWGYFSLDELEQTQLSFGLKVERDLYWSEGPAHQTIPALKN